MELLLSSPVPIIAGGIFISIFAGVFIYELRAQKRQRDAPPAAKIPNSFIPQVLPVSHPPPPQAPPPKVEMHVPPPVVQQTVGLKKKSKKGIVLATSFFVFLLASLGATVYLTSERQQVFNFAQVTEPSPTSPLLTAREKPTSEPTGSQLALLLAKASPSPTSGSSASPTVAPLPTSGAGATAGLICVGLSAEPLSGSAPLKVTFTAEGTVQGGEITGFLFDFGDGQEKTIERSFGPDGRGRQQVIYSYPKSGVFRASLRVRGKNDTWSDIPQACVVTITVSAGSNIGGQTGTIVASPTAKLAVQPKTPAAGSLTPTLVFMVGGLLLVGLSAIAFLF